MLFLVHWSMLRILNFRVNHYKLYSLILVYLQLRLIRQFSQSIWHWSDIIWRLQSWWIWCFWSCRSLSTRRFANQFTSKLHGVIIIECYRSTGDWKCYRGDEGPDLGWIFALWIDNECCRPCHRHCRLSRSSCSWHTLYKVNIFFFWNDQRFTSSVFLVNLFWMMVLPLFYFKYSNLSFILVLVQSLPQTFIDRF